MHRTVKRSAEDIFVDVFCYVVCVVVFLGCFYPFYYVLVLSFNDGPDALRRGIYVLPRVFTLENYAAFFKDSVWFNGLKVSILRTLIGTVCTVLFTSLVAYGLSFRRLKFRKFYLMIMIFCMFFSGGLIPYYVVLRFLGLINTFWVYIVPGLLNLFFVLVGITFFQGIPGELRESAIIDGASELRVFFRIIIPLSMPLMATIALFSGVGQWNSWFDSAFFVQSKNLRTLAYVLMMIINKNILPAEAATAVLARPVTSQSIQMAAMMITVGPIVCAYPFLQKCFVKGVVIGAVKG